MLAIDRYGPEYNPKAPGMDPSGKCVLAIRSSKTKYLDAAEPKR
jgi:hypothetical protein